MSKVCAFACMQGIHETHKDTVCSVGWMGARSVSIMAILLKLLVHSAYIPTLPCLMMASVSVMNLILCLMGSAPSVQLLSSPATANPVLFSDVLYALMVKPASSAPILVLGQRYIKVAAFVPTMAIYLIGKAYASLAGYKVVLCAKNNSIKLALNASTLMPLSTMACASAMEGSWMTGIALFATLSAMSMVVFAVKRGTKTDALSVTISNGQRLTRMGYVTVLIRMWR